MLQHQEKFDVAAQIEASMANNSAICGNDSGERQLRLHQGAVEQGRNKTERPSVMNGTPRGSVGKRFTEEANADDANYDRAKDAIVESTVQKRKASGPPIPAIAFPSISGHDNFRSGAFPILPSPSSISSCTFRGHRQGGVGALWPDWICSLRCDGKMDIAECDDFNGDSFLPIPGRSSRQPPTFVE